MVTKDQCPELVVGDCTSQRFQEVVPLRHRRHVGNGDLVVGVPIGQLPGSSPRLPVEQRGHPVAQGPADVSGRVLRRLKAGYLALHPEQGLLGGLLCEVGVADQHATGLAADEPVDGMQEVAMRTFITHRQVARPLLGDFGPADLLLACLTSGIAMLSDVPPDVDRRSTTCASFVGLYVLRVHTPVLS